MPSTKSTSTTACSAASTAPCRASPARKCWCTEWGNQASVTATRSPRASRKKSNTTARTPMIMMSVLEGAPTAADQPEQAGDQQLHPPCSTNAFAEGPVVHMRPHLTLGDDGISLPDFIPVRPICCFASTVAIRDFWHLIPITLSHSLLRRFGCDQKPSHGRKCPPGRMPKAVHFPGKSNNGTPKACFGVPSSIRELAGGQCRPPCVVKGTR